MCLRKTDLVQFVIPYRSFNKNLLREQNVDPIMFIDILGLR